MADQRQKPVDDSGMRPANGRPDRGPDSLASLPSYADLATKYHWMFGSSGMPMSAFMRFREQAAPDRQGGAGGNEGLLRSDVPGRTDRLPIHVKPESYVIPADIVSGLGQGNTDGGAAILNNLLGMDGVAPAQMKSGGAVDMAHKVPIIAAGGEYVVPPSVVTKLGGGDIKKGHKVLDGLVKRVRTHTAKRLVTLPGPKRG